MAAVNPSLSLIGARTHQVLNAGQKGALTLTGIGLLLLFLAFFGVSLPAPTVWLVVSLLALGLGGAWYGWAAYRQLPAGIKNNGVWLASLTSRGILGWLTAIVLTGFYVLLYFFPAHLGLATVAGEANQGIVGFFDPLSRVLNGNPASQWFVYGTLYTVAILAMGVKFIYKYRHNRYQVVRTLSVMFFQLGFAFLIPEILSALQQPSMDLKNMWPLNYYFFYDWNIKKLATSGGLGIFMLGWGVAMIFVVSPVLTYLYGKRWYCSWVCGCGGLAETAGDPFRQLSDKSLGAWKVERWVIHSVLVLAVIMTLAVLHSFFRSNPATYWVTREMFLGVAIATLLGVALLLWLRPRVFKGVPVWVKGLATVLLIGIVVLTLQAYLQNQSRIFGLSSYKLREWYGFYIGSIFSGVIGVGFYPIFGSRVWCRFGCPMAAILGLQQRFFSRFRITVNGGQCISCGNCSTYCEMGIDVRAYAQRGQDVVRASCVGCGICAAVCPRGVLRLENSAADVSTRAAALRTLHLDPKEGVRLL
ncbi:MAG: 4Fe-4S binding protein [Lewinellaceae bacterium]|nr:4Fe-4S binding protein [Lewinellaceae bacterium]